MYAYSACANTTPIFSLGETCVSACRWNMLDQDHRMGMPGQDQNQFLSQLDSVSGLHWVTTDFPFQLRMVAQDYPWLSTKRGTQASELPASGPCQVQAGLPATALWLLRPGGCKCFDFSSTKGLRAYLQKRKASHSATSMLICGCSKDLNSFVSCGAQAETRGSQLRRCDIPREPSEHCFTV